MKQSTLASGGPQWQFSVDSWRNNYCLYWDKVLVYNKVFQQYYDQILKSTELTSNEAMDSEQVEADNSFDSHIS